MEWGWNGGEWGCDGVGGSPPASQPEDQVRRREGWGSSPSTGTTTSSGQQVNPRGASSPLWLLWGSSRPGNGGASPAAPRGPRWEGESVTLGVGCDVSDSQENMINAVIFPQRCQRLVCACCHEEGRGQASSRPGNFGNREGIQRVTERRGHERSWPGMGFFSGEPPQPRYTQGTRRGSFGLWTQRPLWKLPSPGSDCRGSTETWALPAKPPWVKCPAASPRPQTTAQLALLLGIPDQKVDSP